MELGPSGFPFEKYIAEILKMQGYKAQVNVIMDGKCVKHEVDVIAEKGDRQFMIECKYHSQRGTICDVKVPLYIQSRFTDLQANRTNVSEHAIKLHQGWVVTNTRFSTDAIKYGLCSGLKLVGWDFPERGSLNEQIDQLGLYPLTCLTTITQKEKHFLLDHNMILCRDLCENHSILRSMGASETRIQRILEEADHLCQHLAEHAL